MAFSGKASSLLETGGGGYSDDVYRGSFQFDGSATTLELPVPLATIRPGSTLTLIPVSPTHVETVYIDEGANINANGELDVDEDNEITIDRLLEVGGTVEDDLLVQFFLQGASKEA